MDIVCVSVMGWGHPFPTSRHHLARELGRRHRVLFVDNAMNAATAFKRAKEGHVPAQDALAAWGGGPNPREVAPGIYQLVPPPVVPMGRLSERLFAPVYGFNQRVQGASIRQACQKLGMARPHLWLSFNVLGSEGAIAALAGRPVLYHCTDAIEALPGTSAHAPAIERRLLRRCDLMVASSKALLDDKGPLARRAVYLPHGAETERFGASGAPLPGLRDWAAGRPLVGFIGNVEERVDCDLLGAVADRHPEWAFALAGPVTPARREAAARLAARPNVRLLGLLPSSDAPAFLRAVDVAMIPYVTSAQTRAIYPLKLNEYLAAGKPAVLTPFADLAEFDGVVEVGTGVDGFGAAIARALADSPARREARLRVARANGWEGRAAAFEGLLASIA